MKKYLFTIFIVLLFKISYAQPITNNLIVEISDQIKNTDSIIYALFDLYDNDALTDQVWYDET